MHQTVAVLSDVLNHAVGIRMLIMRYVAYTGTNLIKPILENAEKCYELVGMLHTLGGLFVVPPPKAQD